MAGAIVGVGGASGAMGPGVSNTRTAAGVAAQDVANLLPDEFDLLVREAMYSAVKSESARTATFTTGPRGIEGPMKNIAQAKARVPGEMLDDDIWLNGVMPLNVARPPGGVLTGSTGA